MITTSIYSIVCKRVTQYFSFVTGKTIIGAPFFKVFFASIHDIIGDRFASCENILRKTKNVVLQEMEQIVQNKKVDAKLAINLDCETIVKKAICL